MKSLYTAPLDNNKENIVYILWLTILCGEAHTMGKDLGRLIREMRKARGMSRKELARRLDVSSWQVRRLEGGEGLTVTRLIQIADAFGVPVSAFMYDVKADVPTDSGHRALPPDEARLLRLYRELGNKGLKIELFEMLERLRDVGSN